MRKKHWLAATAKRQTDVTSVMQRRSVFAGTASGHRVTNGPSTAVLNHTPADSVRRHDFGVVPLYARSAASFPRINDQTQSGGLAEEFTKGADVTPVTDKPTTDLNLGEGETQSTTTPVIDSVELVSSPSGAVGGYPEKEDTCDASLSKPGPFNDLAFKGSIANVHQIHFHVSQGNPGDLRATRIVNRTATGRGQPFGKSGNDGPPDHEYKYTKDKMVIADAPGWCSTLKESDFPVSYSGDFALYAWDAPTKQILASIAYHVEIKKAHFSDGGATNTVSVTDKKVGGAVSSPVKPKK
jgi:hypothetical protein